MPELFIQSATLGTLGFFAETSHPHSYRSNVRRRWPLRFQQHLALGPHLTSCNLTILFLKILIAHHYFQQLCRGRHIQN